MKTVPVIDALQAGTWDERARAESAIPSRVLMEAAGRGLAVVAQKEFQTELREGVLVAAGPGNNGGDGWVVARALRSVGVRVTVASQAESKSRDCIANRELAVADGVAVIGPDESWPPSGLVVDALLGTGASGSPRGVLGDLAQRVAAAGAPVLAIDGPSGLDLTTGETHGPCRADVTATFGGVRRGHLLARDWCGKVVVLDIGFPEPDPDWPTLVTDRWAGTQLPTFHPAMHKGQRGRVLVVGGEGGMAGAAIHAARAALGAGAGLVRLAGSGRAVDAAQAALPDAVTITTELGPRLEDGLEEAIGWADALVLGPGLGRGELRTKFVDIVLSESRVPTVVDADALHAWGVLTPARAEATVLTPHVGEFRAVFPDLQAELESDRFAAAQKAAESCGCTVLLKGVPTVVSDAESSRLVVASGNPALATGGSGDLLAGFIAAFLAREVAGAPAAALGAHALGRAADIATDKTTVRSTRPADVVNALPEVWKQWLSPPVFAPPILLELEPPPTS